MFLLLDLVGSFLWETLFQALPALVTSRRVPDVVGLDRGAAELLLYSIPLGVVADGPDLGSVVSQHPAAGSRVRRNHEVTIILTGKEPVGLPG